MAVPAGWSNVAGVGTESEPDALPFWKALGSEDLNRLIDLALAQNLDLEAALHRIEQARAGEGRGGAAVSVGQRERQRNANL